MKKLSFFIFISLIIAACSAKTFAPTDQQLSAMQEKVPGITLESAQAGYKLYSEKCAGCHQLYHPARYTIAQWNNILPKMFPKAKLSDKDQQKRIREYLHALSR
jgi:hypothetical protein